MLTTASHLVGILRDADLLLELASSMGIGRYQSNGRKVGSVTAFIARNQLPPLSLGMSADKKIG